MGQGQTTTPGITCPTLCDKLVGSLPPPANHVTIKMQETGPTVCSPCPRRLECVTICSTFSTVILRSWVLVRSGVWIEPRTFRTAVWCFTDLAIVIKRRQRHCSCLIRSSILVLDIAVNYKVQTSDSKLSKYWIKIIQSNKLTFQKRSATHKTAELVAFTTVTLTRRVRRGAGNKLSQQKQKVITQVFFFGWNLWGY